jgi:general secretion pathway protein M
MKNWFAQLAPRERLTLILGAAVAVPLLLYVLVWGPLSREVDALETRVVEQQETLTWMQSAAAEVRQLRATGRQAPPESTGGSLLSIVNQSAQRMQLSGSIQRMNPQGDQGIELQLTGVAFDRFVRWLGELETTHGISVTSLSLSRATAPGQVDVRLTLERAA